MLIDAFVYNHAQNCVGMDGSTINKGLWLFSPDHWQAMRTPVCAPSSSLVLNMGLNFLRAVP